MERFEFNGIIKVIMAAYPGRTKFDKFAMELWFRELQDLDGDDVLNAVRDYITTDQSGFPPTIGQVRGKVVKRTSDHDWSKGWDLVTKAVRRFGYYQQKAAISWIASQDKAAAEVIDRLGYPAFCLADSDDTTWRANFRMVYEKITQREEHRDALPGELKQRIGKLFNERKEIGCE